MGEIETEAKNKHALRHDGPKDVAATILRGIKLDENASAESVLQEVVRVLQKHLTRTIDMFQAWDKGER